MQREIFWDCIQKSLDANKKGQDGKRRILSIVADQLSYDEIKKNLNVSKISNKVLFITYHFKILYI